MKRASALDFHFWIIIAWRAIQEERRGELAKAAMDYCKQQERDGHRDDGDVTEWKKVAELRAVVEAQDPACKVSPSPSP